MLHERVGYALREREDEEERQHERLDPDRPVAVVVQVPVASVNSGSNPGKLGLHLVTNPLGVRLGVKAKTRAHPTGKARVFLRILEPAMGLEPATC